MSLYFPLPHGASEPFPCSRTSDACRVFDANEENLKEYNDALINAGFSLLSERRLKFGIFRTYMSNTVKLNVSLATEKNELRVFSEPYRPAPPFSFMGEKKYERVTLNIPQIPGQKKLDKIYDKEAIDTHLRETLRIMNDYLEIKSK